jgi:hypothetical protein
VSEGSVFQRADGRWTAKYRDARASCVVAEPCATMGA